MVTPSAARKAKVVLPKDPAACWIFQGTATRYGNGQVKVAGKTYTCQRWMFEQLFGPVPDGMRITSTCGNGLCINPYHLVAQVHADIIRGSNQAVLTSGDVAEIRAVAQENRTAAMADVLADRMGCHRRTVQRVWGKETWSVTESHRTARRSSRQDLDTRATA